MVESQASYLLEILFNKKQITSEVLDNEIKNKMSKVLSNIHEIEVSDLSDKTIKISIRADLKNIDCCHTIINEMVVEKQWNCIRIIDEAGDYVRHEAYQILSQIEQRFRAFINQAFIEVDDFGFEWWDTFASSNSPSKQKKIESIQEQALDNKVPLHPLECTNFEDLLEIIDSKVSKASEKDPVSIEDLINLFSSHNTIAKVKTELKKRITKISYWDRIFSRYFQDEQQWKKVKKSLNFVIDERNKVMHHRPIKSGVINGLSKSKDQIFLLLDSAKSQLTQEERNEAQEDIKQLQELLDDEELKELADKEELQELLNNSTENSSGVILNFTDEFKKDLKSLSNKEQNIVVKKLNQLTSKQIPVYSKYFQKLPKIMEDDTYIFRVNNRIRIICALDFQKDRELKIVNLFNVGYHDTIYYKLSKF